MLTDVGPVEITVLCDRNGSSGAHMVASQEAAAAHLAEVSGMEVSHQISSTITDKVIDRMVEWQNRRSIRSIR